MNKIIDTKKMPPRRRQHQKVKNFIKTHKEFQSRSFNKKIQRGILIVKTQKRSFNYDI